MCNESLFETFAKLLFLIENCAVAIEYLSLFHTDYVRLRQLAIAAVHHGDNGLRQIDER
jgi:hypothetical protein